MVIYTNISSFVLPLNGGFPQSIIYVRIPKAQISTEQSYGSFLTISGAIYKGEPSVSVKFPSDGS